MKNSNLRGLDQDLNRGIEYNRKHGGVSDELKRMMKRPEEGWGGNWRMNAMGSGNRKAYEEGWEHIFGKKLKKNVQG